MEFDMKVAERENLKAELLHLKKCQIQYFILSVSAAGITTWLGSLIKDEHNFFAHKKIYLAPLLVILPCWWIFFDKSTTITRIVGYLKLLEGMIITGKVRPFTYIGWENSLDLRRKIEQNEKTRFSFKNLKIGVKKGLMFQCTHKYWTICWLTFAGLTATTLFLSYPGEFFILSFWNLSLLISALSLFYNLGVLGALIDGSKSYEKNHEKWKAILRTKDAADVLKEMFRPPSET